MDAYVALGLIGQQEVAQALGVNVTDLTCLGHVLGAGESPCPPGTWPNASTSPPAP